MRKRASCNSAQRFHRFVTGSLISSLTAYDQLAVRSLGLSNVNYRTAALASFVSYPIAHGTGAVLPVSAAIRYRIYSAHGVGAVDVARICFLTGLTFWLGNLTMLGLSGSYTPLAFGPFSELPTGLSRALAIVLLVAVAGYTPRSEPTHASSAETSGRSGCRSGRTVLLQIAASE